MKLISVHIYEQIGRGNASTDFRGSTMLINPNHIIKIDEKIPSDRDDYKYKMSFYMSDGSTIQNIYSWIETDEINRIHPLGKDETPVSDIREFKKP